MVPEEHRQQYSGSFVGLGGWLIVVGIGVLVRPILLSKEIWDLGRIIYLSGLWNDSNPDLEPAIKAIVLTEVVVNIFLFLVCLFLIYLFFAKKKLFPKLLIVVLIFIPVFVVVDAYLINILYPQVAVFGSETIRSALRTSVYAAIWVPYLLVSKRVEATFVNPLRRQSDAEIFS